MTSEAFWATTGAGILSGVVATLVSGGLVWLAAFIRQRRSGPTAPTAALSANGPTPTNGTAATATTGSIAVGNVRDGDVRAEIKNTKNVKKKTTKVTSTTNVTNHTSNGGTAQASDENWWVAPAITLLVAAAASLFFVRWNDYAFLGASIIFGVAFGSFLGTTGWSVARHVWSPGATLVAIQAALAAAAFVAIWLGINTAVIDGWTLSSLRDAVAVATDTAVPSQWGTVVLDAIGGAGIRAALQLFLAAIASLALACFLAVTMIDWWRYLAALAGKIKKKKKAKRALRFERADGAAILGRIVPSLLLSTVGIVAAWVQINPGGVGA